MAPAQNLDPINHDELVEQRGQLYGESWAMTSEWICENADLLKNAGPSAFPLVMMHNKIMRALTSPGQKDHYDDIIGYAKLALRRFEQMPGTGHGPVHWLTEEE